MLQPFGTKSFCEFSPRTICVGQVHGCGTGIQAEVKKDQVSEQKSVRATNVNMSQYHPVSTNVNKCKPLSTGRIPMSQCQLKMPRLPTGYFFSFPRTPRGLIAAAHYL
jgi:hypothetical protein